MSRKHDYLCAYCGDIQCDVVLPIGQYADCLVCGEKMGPYYGFWEDLLLEDHGRSRNDKVDRNGYIKNWQANDDPLTRIEILGGAIKDKGVRSFTDEQQAVFRAKLMRDGDSATLRNEVLAVRRENLKKQREEYKKKLTSQ